MHALTSHDSPLDPAALLESVAFVAVEHEASLDLTRLVNLIDLYAHHLREAGGLPARPFEAFVGDALALRRAAALAAADSGVETLAPAPLGTGDGARDRGRSTPERAVTASGGRPVGVERVPAPEVSAVPTRRAPGPVRLRLV